MKKSIFTLLLISCTLSAMAQKKAESPSEIKDITVYLSGAEITRKANVYVSAGMSEIIFKDLSTDINANTIQVGATGELIIMGATFQLNYMDTKEELAEVKMLNDSVTLISNQIKNNQNQKDVINGLMDILAKNTGVGGNNVGVTLANLQSVYDFYLQKMTQLKADLTNLDIAGAKLEARLNQLNSQLWVLNQKKNQPTGEIVVQVSAKTALSANFTLSYLATKAGWSPQYDVRCDSINSPVRLTYKADVHQYTGEDWKNVKLTLSTANPTASATGPILMPWYLSFYNAYSYDNGINNISNYNNAPTINAQMLSSGSPAYSWDDNAKDSQSTASYTTVSNQQLSVEFAIDIPYDILSDNKIHKVSIQEYTVPAIFEYYAVPKMDRDAFLLARLTGWSKLNMLSGNANIFFEGAYVGQSYINTVTTKDTLDISLGRDKKIIIKRIKEKDYTKEKLIGTDIKQTYNFTIAVRNSKTTSLTIKILDQFPVSNNEQIKVTRDDAGSSTVDDITGKMTWVLKLKPGEERKLKFGFTVQYPSTQTIEGL